MTFKSLQAEFEDKFIPEPNSGCWLWLAATNPQGYGRFWAKRDVHAHRFSWELYRSRIPKGMFVLHRCDVPACVNPDHLYVGTHVQNMRDMATRKRAKWGGAVGSRHGSAKMTEELVTNIRKDARSISELRRHYGLAESTLRKILARKTWKHVP